MPLSELGYLKKECTVLALWYHCRLKRHRDQNRLCDLD
jgi:hypothetical protein